MKRFFDLIKKHKIVSINIINTLIILPIFLKGLIDESKIHSGLPSFAFVDYFIFAGFVILLSATIASYTEKEKMEKIKNSLMSPILIVTLLFLLVFLPFNINSITKLIISLVFLVTYFILICLVGFIIGWLLSKLKND